MKRVAALIAFFGFACATHAAPFDCDTVFMPDKRDTAAKLADVGLAAVTGTDKAYFSKCIGSDCATKAETKTYVVSGDIVLTGEWRAGWVCALFPNRLGGTQGWLPDGRLTAMPVAKNPPLTAWAGKWQMHDNANIQIKVSDAKLAVTGEAYWINSITNGAHTGEIDGTAMPEHGIVHLQNGDDEYACRADLRLVGPYLVVEDNNRCGGLNVSFTGAYRGRGP